MVYLVLYVHYVQGLHLHLSVRRIPEFIIVPGAKEGERTEMCLERD